MSRDGLLKITNDRNSLYEPIKNKNKRSFYTLSEREEIIKILYESEIKNDRKIKEIKKIVHDLKIKNDRKILYDPKKKTIISR